MVYVLNSTLGTAFLLSILLCAKKIVSLEWKLLLFRCIGSYQRSIKCQSHDEFCVIHGLRRYCIGAFVNLYIFILYRMACSLMFTVKNFLEFSDIMHSCISCYTSSEWASWFKKRYNCSVFLDICMNCDHGQTVYIQQSRINLFICLQVSPQFTSLLLNNPGLTLTSQC